MGQSNSIGNRRSAASLPPLPMDAELWQAVADALGLSPQHTRMVELVLRGLCDKEMADVMGIRRTLPPDPSP